MKRDQKCGRKKGPNRHQSTMQAAVARFLVQLHAFPVLQTSLCSWSALTVAKTAAKLGLLWLLYTYVTCMVDVVGGDTLKAVWDGRPPPHRVGSEKEKRRLRDIPQDIMRVMDSLQVVAKQRL